MVISAKEEWKRIVKGHLKCWCINKMPTLNRTIREGLPEKGPWAKTWGSEDLLRHLTGDHSDKGRARARSSRHDCALEGMRSNKRLVWLEQRERRRRWGPSYKVLGHNRNLAFTVGGMWNTGTENDTILCFNRINLASMLKTDWSGTERLFSRHWTNLEG